ncbi:unnamed protein product, partial [Rotaria sp. Silwood2]
MEIYMKLNEILCRAAQQLADEHMDQIRRNQYCIFVLGRSPLTNTQATHEIIEEAKILFQHDLQAMDFGIVIQKSQVNNKDDEHILEFDTDSNDESENEYDISSSRVSS